MYCSIVAFGIRAWPRTTKTAPGVVLLTLAFGAPTAKSAKPSPLVSPRPATASPKLDEGVLFGPMISANVLRRCAELDHRRRRPPRDHIGAALGRGLERRARTEDQVVLPILVYVPRRGDVDVRAVDVDLINQPPVAGRHARERRARQGRPAEQHVHPGGPDSRL